MERMEDTLLQVVGSVQQLNSAITRVAEVISKQQKANTTNFKLLMAADERNTNRLENALQQITQGFENLGNRLERLENR